MFFIKEDEKMNIILCGMMGVGKTSVGIKIAELTGRCWYDTDDLIVVKHGKIMDIFEFYGEEYFRNLETQTIKEISKEDNLVVSTGGGAVLRKENVSILKKNSSKIVYLRANADTLMKRVSPEDNTRPLLAKNSEESMRNRLEQLLAARSDIYSRVADYVVDTDGKTIEEVANEILVNVPGSVFKKASENAAEAAAPAPDNAAEAAAPAPENAGEAEPRNDR